MKLIFCKLVVRDTPSRGGGNLVHSGQGGINRDSNSAELIEWIQPILQKNGRPRAKLRSLRNIRRVAS